MRRGALGPAGFSAAAAALSPAVVATAVFAGGGAFAGAGGLPGEGLAGAPREGALGAFAADAPAARGAAMGAAEGASYMASTLCGAIDGGDGMPICAGAASGMG
jgi:hypothetical protein